MEKITYNRREFDTFSVFFCDLNKLKKKYINIIIIYYNYL